MELQSDLSGAVWSTTALYLKGLSIVRRNSEYHHFDIGGGAGVVTDNTGAVISSNLFDGFGVARNSSGSAATPWRRALLEEEGLIRLGTTDYIPGRALGLQQKGPKPPPPPPDRHCDAARTICYAKAQATVALCGAGVSIVFAGLLAICNADLEPFTRILCIKRAMDVGLSLLATCGKIYEEMTRKCDRDYEDCMRKK